MCHTHMPLIFCSFPMWTVTVMHQHKVPYSELVQISWRLSQRQAVRLDCDKGLGLVQILGIAAGMETTGQLIGNRLG